MVLGLGLEEGVDNEAFVQEAVEEGHKRAGSGPQRTPNSFGRGKGLRWPAPVRFAYRSRPLLEEACESVRMDRQPKGPQGVSQTSKYLVIII